MVEPGRPLPIALIMPGNVRAGQVISLVEVTGGLGPKVDVSRLADEMDYDIAVLLSTLDAAEMLGLVRSEKGDVCLTELGLRFQKTSRNKVRMLRDRLAAIEPFRTALELASRGKPVTAGQVAESLSEIGIKWHYQPELNESLINDFLVHWTIYGGLMRYDGKSGKFQRT